MKMSDLAAYCATQKMKYPDIKRRCLHCDHIEECNTYIRFVSGIAPCYWNGNKLLPEVELDREGFHKLEEK